MVKWAAVFGGLAVILGAFGAHGLSRWQQNGTLSAEDIRTYETAVRYQFFHALALLALPALSHLLQKRFLQNAAYAFITGIILFSGSLYCLVFSAPVTGHTLTWIGAVTPVGGLFFIAGWILLFFSAMKHREEA